MAAEPWRGHGGWGPNRTWHGYYPHLHEGWYHGGWRGLGYRSGAWYSRPRPFGWLIAPGETVVYDNPFYVAPADATLVTDAFDYSVPIPVPETTDLQAPVDVPEDIMEQPFEAPVPEEDTANQEEAGRLFDEARSAFRSGDYDQAEELVGRAIELLPGDPVLHEFRALALFAQHRYREAAAGLYAVLAAGPGWDWDTLKGLYDSVSTYTRQLRALENYQLRHPRSASASFLLAYHYMILGATDDAIEMLRRTVELQPDNQLAAQLLEALEQAPSADDDRPRPGE